MKAAAGILSLITGVLLWATTSLAASPLPLPLSGEYAFQGSLIERQVRDSRIVYAFTEAGKTQLQELKADGYACEVRPRETFLCRKYLKGLSLPAELRAQVEKQLTGFKIAFLNHAPEAPDTPENEAPDLKEWRILQKVRVGETYYPFYRYQILGDEIHKIALGESGDSTALYFVVNSQDQLSSMNEVSLRDSGGYRTYWFEAVFPQATAEHPAR